MDYDEDRQEDFDKTNAGVNKLLKQKLKLNEKLSP